MSQLGSDFNMATINNSATDLHKQSIGFIWKIRDVKLLTPGQITVSDTFSTDNGDIKLRLNYHHLTYSCSNSLLTLCLLSSTTLNLYCECDWTIQNKRSKEIIKESKNCILKFTEHGEAAVISYISSVDIKKGDITVNIQVKVFVEELLKCREANILKKDIGRFKDKVELKDLTLVVEGKKLKVHKLIVLARSPVLAAMLDEDKDCDELHIPDVDYYVMEHIVNYMYTDQVEDIETRAHQLYPVACRFALLGLKALCEDSLLMTLDLSNPWETLELGHEISKDFEARIIKVIAGNNSWDHAELDLFVVRNPRLYVDVICASENKELDEGVRYLYEEEKQFFDDEEWAAVQPVFAEVILNTLTIENAFRTLVLADGEPEDFTSQVIKFIKSHLKKLTNLKDFDCLALEHPQLYLDTACAITDDKIEDAARIIYPKACKSEWLDVKTLCEEIFVKSLTVENAAQTFLLTEGQPGSIKDRIIDFMKTHGAEVLVSAGFKSLVFVHPHLLQEVSQAIDDVGNTSSGHAAG